MKRLSILVLLLAIALAACSQPADVTPTDEPPVVEAAPTEAVVSEVATVEPAPTELPPTEAAPVDSPTVESETAPPADGETLTGTTWEWVSTQTPVELITASDPARYQVVFNEDGSANITNDCNMVIAQYTFDGSAISITPGPSTLVACPPDSQADVFLQQLSGASIAFFQEGELFIDLFADAGTMRFQPATEAAPTLTGTTWQWLETQTPNELITAVDPARYQVVFNEDGSANITNDCNMVIAQYTFDGSAISITPGPSTLVACPPDSQADVFLQQLSAAAIAFFQDGELYIDLFADAGTMRFSALPEVELTDAAPGEPSGTVIAPDGIFLRTGPGTTFPAVGAAPQGESGRLIGISEDGLWYLVEAPAVPGGQVWVAAEFVDATSAEGLPVTAAPPVGTTPPVVTEPPVGTTPLPDDGSLSGGAAGITFRVTSFGPIDAPVEVIPGSTITAVFDDVAGIVSGNAGCNSYTGTLTRVETFFTVGPIATTLRLCDSPPGVMEQEAAYLAALGGTNGYLWEQSTGAGGTVTAGRLSYTLPDGTNGRINLVSP